MFAAWHFKCTTVLVIFFKMWGYSQVSSLTAVMIYYQYGSRWWSFHSRSWAVNKLVSWICSAFLCICFKLADPWISSLFQLKMMMTFVDFFFTFTVSLIREEQGNKIKHKWRSIDWHFMFSVIQLKSNNLRILSRSFKTNYSYWIKNLKLFFPKSCPLFFHGSPWG